MKEPKKVNIKKSRDCEFCKKHLPKNSKVIKYHITWKGINVLLYFCGVVCYKNYKIKSSYIYATIGKFNNVHTKTEIIFKK